MSADFVFDIANIFFVASLVVGLVATCAVIWSGKLKDLQSKIEVANAVERAAAANERAATLEQESIKDKIELARLREKLSWREISPNQREILTRSLSNNKINFEVRFDKGDEETTQFAQNIQSVLEAARCQVTMNAENFGGSSGGRYTGVEIQGVHDNRISEFVQESFASAGIAFKIGAVTGPPHPDRPEAQVVVNIFVRPRPNYGPNE